MEKIIEKTYQFAQHYHENDTSGHDFEHIKRVFYNAQKLLDKTQKADPFIVKMSALLHDIDDHKMKTDGTVAKTFLQTLDLPDQTITQILQTIDAISFSKSGSKPHFQTNEQKLLSDADKLDALGAIGICRTIQFATQNKFPLFDETIFPEQNLTREKYKDLTRKTNTSINHFFDKLLKLHSAMQTPAGKKEAQKRHQFMILFLKQFFMEQNALEWLNYLDRYLEKIN